MIEYIPVVVVVVKSFLHRQNKKAVSILPLTA